MDAGKRVRYGGAGRSNAKPGRCSSSAPASGRYRRRGRWRDHGPGGLSRNFAWNGSLIERTASRRWTQPSWESVIGVEHGGSKTMNTHRAGQTVIHRGHLCLVAPVAPEIRLSRREVRTMRRVGALLRRRAARLPKDSLLRAELMEAAEYYATGADQAAIGRSRHGHDATGPA